MRCAKSRDNSARAARSTLIPSPLHRGDDRGQRPLDRLVESGHLVADEPRLQQHMQPKRRVGPLGGEVAGALARHFGKGDQALAGADKLFERGQLVLQKAPHQTLDLVVELAAVEHIGHQHRAVMRTKRDALARQQMRGGLDVVADLENAGILEQRAQFLDRRLERDAAGLGEDRAPPATRWPSGT